VLAQGCSQRCGSRIGAAAERIDLRAARRADQIDRQLGQARAARARRIEIAAHQVDRGGPRPCERVVGLFARGGRKVGQRLVEAVLVLQHDGAQRAHRRRRIGRLPPRLQHGLRIADVARITLGERLLDIGHRQRRGGLGVARLAPP
jgi:hypothetical protein